MQAWTLAAELPDVPLADALELLLLADLSRRASIAGAALACSTLF